MKKLKKEQKKERNLTASVRSRKKLFFFNMNYKVKRK